MGCHRDAAQAKATGFSGAWQPRATGSGLACGSAVVWAGPRLDLVAFGSTRLAFAWFGLAGWLILAWLDSRTRKFFLVTL